MGRAAGRLVAVNAVVEGLHDVDLAGQRPGAVDRRIAVQQPYRRPGALATGDACTHFDSAVLEVEFAPGVQPTGCIRIAFLAAFDAQDTACDTDVVSAVYL